MMWVQTRLGVKPLASFIMSLNECELDWVRIAEQVAVSPETQMR